MATPTTISSTTQQFLDIYDITNDLLIMKDGSTALIVTVDAMNFGLLAEEEQDAIMYAYAGLLNSLNYSVQIVIRSQTKDATNYLNLLKEQETRATSDTKKKQIAAYRDFVAELIRERNVLDKKFYIVIPATNLEMGLLPPQTVVPGVKQIDISSVDRSVILEKAKTTLEPKRDHLIAQFGRIGLYARQLVTQEIIQLFYTSYNPEAAEGQQITNTSDYTTPLVSGQTQMTDTPTPTPPINNDQSGAAVTPPMGQAPSMPGQPAPVNPGAPNPVPSPEPTVPPTPTSQPAPTAASPTTSPSPMQPPAGSTPNPGVIEPMPASPTTPSAASPAATPTANPGMAAEADDSAKAAQDVINMTAQQIGGAPSTDGPSSSTGSSTPGSSV